MGEHDHPEVTMHTHALARYMKHVRTGDWPAVAELMLSSAEKLAACGAAFAICPDNTIHQAYDLVEARSPIPWLHIARVVLDEAVDRSYRKLAVLGTRYLMEGPVYSEAAAEAGIATEVPDAGDREHINGVIFEELVNGVFRDTSRLRFRDVIARMGERGADAVVLGCTEIPLLIDEETSPLPVLDSTRLLARAALRRAVASG
jgi:aspartate racemase